MRWKTHGTRQFNKTKETINLFSLCSCHAKETTGHCGPVLVGSLNGDLSGVKHVAVASPGNLMAFLALSAVPDVAGGCCIDGIRKGLEQRSLKVA